MDRSIAQDKNQPLLLGMAGALLMALATFASLDWRNGLVAALAGAVGMALWRKATLGQWRGTIVLFDLLAFAIFAIQRNDGLAFWQLVGPWSDVLRFNFAGAAISYAIYIIGSLFTISSEYRPLRPIEAIGLIAIPFVFNLIVVLGADWHMAEIGGWAAPGVSLPFSAQVFVGRTLVLFVVSEAILVELTMIGLDRLPRSARGHGLLFVGAAFGALTPLIANSAQMVVTPVLAILVGAAAAALAQAGLWAIVYVATGLPLDAMAGRPPTFTAVWSHWRSGFVKGAIYGGLFMALVLSFALALSQPAVAALLAHGYWLLAPLLGAAFFPFAQTLISSADGTPPFFGRLTAAYRTRKAYARGVVVGFGCAFAYSIDLAADGGGSRFLVGFAIGALAYAGVDLVFDALRITAGERTKAADLAVLRARRGAGRIRRRGARLVFRRGAARGRDREILGLRGHQLPARRPQARRFHDLSALQQIRRR